MSERTTEAAPSIDLDVDLPEPPGTVWRAISLPAFRDLWLPPGDLASPEADASVPGREVSYRLREREPPFLESVVTFRLAPNDAGGTRLSIRHELNDARLGTLTRRPANANGPLMRAA